MQLSRDLNCQYRTAFVLAHKIREAIGAGQAAAEELRGEVEVDGGYFGGHIRPANWKADRKTAASPASDRQAEGGGCHA